MSKIILSYIALILLNTTVIFAETSQKSAISDEIETSVSGLILDKARQRLAGIKTKTLTPTKFNPELQTYGVALDLQPLVDLRIQYFDSVAEKSIAEAAIRESASNLKRLKLLHHENIVPHRKVIEATALWEKDKARLSAHQFKLTGIRTKAIQQWGDLLTNWSLSTDQKQLNELLKPGQSLLQVSLSLEHTITSIPKIIMVASDIREHAVEAQLILRAAQAFSQSESFYYLTHYPSLRAGMKILALLPQSKEALTGVSVDEASVIWHLGHPFVYILKESNLFERRPLLDPIKNGLSWFVQNQLSAGDIIVTQGAQTLLSEEFKEQIPEEDDDED